METFIEVLPFILPFILFNIAVQIYSIVDIHKVEREVILLNKTWWTVAVALVSFGWVIYLLAGRKQ